MYIYKRQISAGFGGAGDRCWFHCRKAAEDSSIYIFVYQHLACMIRICYIYIIFTMMIEFIIAVAIVATDITLDRCLVCVYCLLCVL